MSKLLFLPLLISFSNTAIAFEGNDMYHYGNTWGGMSASCLGFALLGFPKEKSKQLFNSYYEGSKELKNKKIYNTVTEKMYEKGELMYKTCRELYPE